MNHRQGLRTLLCSLLALPLMACGEDSDPGAPGGAGGSAGSGASGGSGTTTTGGSVSECGAATKDSAGSLVVHADAANNYAFSSSFKIGVTPVKPKSELSFDWSGVSKDFLGHDVDPLADIDMVTLLMWKLGQDELETRLNDDALAQRDLVAIAMIYTDNEVTSGGLFDFTSFRMPIEQSMLLAYLDPEAYDPATHAYTIMAVSGTTAGKGTRMMQSFRLDPSSENTAVSLDSNSTQLDYSVDLKSLEPTQIPAGQAEIAIDWSSMTVNALGNDFVPTSIDEVLVARYSLSLDEMQAKFLDLDSIADETWRGKVPSGTSVALSSLTNADGEPFAGIDDSGTWIVALRCGSCANPAPWYLSTLKTCSAP